MPYTHRFAVILALLIGFASPIASAQTPATTVKDSDNNVVLQSNVDGGLLAPGAIGTGTIPTEGAGTRLMWHPGKAAFRAGRVGYNKDGTQWDPLEVGTYSVAFGVDTKSNGFATIAMGDRTTASGVATTAMGRLTTASGEQATAMGLGTTAGGDQATAMGLSTTASGQGATAIGFRTTASNFTATAMGDQTTASESAATTMGLKTTASGTQATAMGRETTASGTESVAMGERTTASGERATAMGIVTTAATNQSLTIGRYNDSNRGNDDSDPSTGPVFVVGNGLPGSRSDALVLGKSGNLTISGTLTENSDRRLKKQIEPLGKAVVRKLDQIRPVRFEFKNQETHPSGKQLGLIAQDVRKEFPALVSEGSSGMLSLAYPKLTAVLLKGLQEQQATIDSLTKRIRSLQTVKERQARLAEQVAALQQDRSDVLPAGWGTSAVLALLLALSSFGAGLLWRRSAA